MLEGKTLVGVDIGASSIKVVQLKESKKRLSVVKWGYAPLPPQAIVDGNIMNSGAVTDALAQIFRDSKITQKEVAIGVAGQSVIIRKITVPMMTDEELAQQINWEAEQHIPFDIKVMSIDYAILKKRPEQGQMDLLLVAAKKEEINEFANLLRTSKLKPVVVDINAFTVQNVFERAYGLTDDQSFAILNVGASISSLNVISKGVSAFTREITNAGNSITEEIQRQMGVPFEQAEEFKLAFAAGQDVPPPVRTAINNACETLAGEVQRSLDFYLATSGESEIARISLCGGSASLPPLAASIEKRARVPVTVFDPLTNMGVEGVTNEPGLRSRAAQLAVAIGLALRSEKEGRASNMVRVNLLPTKKEARTTTSSSGNAWALAVLVLLGVEMLGLGLWYSSLKDEQLKIVRNNQRIEGTIKEIKQTIANHDEIKSQLKELGDRGEAIEKLQRARTGPTSVLLELTRMLTPGKGPTIERDKLEQLKRDDPSRVPNQAWDSRRLWITSFKEIERGVKIVGQARDAEDVSELLRRIALSDYFTDVKLLPGSKAIDTITKLELLRFEISAKVRY